MDTPLLWHIPLSHFSEKVRWTLDYKGITHCRRVLGADYLIRAWWAARISSATPSPSPTSRPQRCWER